MSQGRGEGINSLYRTAVLLCVDHKVNLFMGLLYSYPLLWYNQVFVHTEQKTRFEQESISRGRKNNAGQLGDVRPLLSSNRALSDGRALQHFVNSLSFYTTISFRSFDHRNITRLGECLTSHCNHGKLITDSNSPPPPTANRPQPTAPRGPCTWCVIPYFTSRGCH